MSQLQHTGRDMGGQPRAQLTDCQARMFVLAKSVIMNMTGGTSRAACSVVYPASRTARHRYASTSCVKNRNAKRP